MLREIKISCLAGPGAGADQPLPLYGVIAIGRVNIPAISPCLNQESAYTRAGVRLIRQYECGFAETVLYALDQKDEILSGSTGKPDVIIAAEIKQRGNAGIL